MTLVKVKGHRSIQRDGKIYTPSSPPFEVEDEAAVLLARDGLVEIVPEPDERSIPFGDATHLYVDDESDIPMAHEVQGEVPSVDLDDLPGVTDSLLEVLLEAGIDSVKALAETPAEDLVALKGIGSTTARRLISQASAALKE